jgi:hypothetical protein
VNRETAAVTRRDIRQTGTFRAAVIFAAVMNAFAAAVIVLAAGPLLALVPAVAFIACLVMVLGRTRHLGSLRRQEREQDQSRMTLEDYRHLQRMERELGWEVSEVPPGLEPPPPARRTVRPAARECIRCASPLSPGAGPCGACRQERQARRTAPRPQPPQESTATPRHVAPCPVEVRQARLPAVLRETTIATMKPGRTYYTVPWAMRADTDGRLWLYPGHMADVRRCGTVEMRVELREDGYHVWPVPGKVYAPGAAGGDLVPVAVLEGTAGLALSGTGSLTAKGRPVDSVWSTGGSGRCICPACQQAMRESRGKAPDAVASEHFAALARIGLERCFSRCPVCLSAGRQSIVTQEEP